MTGLGQVYIQILNFKICSGNTRYCSRTHAEDSSIREIKYKKRIVSNFKFANNKIDVR